MRAAGPGGQTPRKDTYVSAVQCVWSAGQYRPHTVWVFKFDKPKTSRLVGGFIFHDHTVYNFSILGKVAA